MEWHPSGVKNVLKHIRVIGVNFCAIFEARTSLQKRRTGSGLLQFIDFEKAFDSLEWSFIEKTLNYYNFGSSLVGWIRLFYTGITSCVQNNGWTSDFFS